MTQTITVKDLIKKLIEHDMDEPVYIGLGKNSKPTACAGIIDVADYSRGGIDFELGIYLIPFETLIDTDAMQEGKQS
jgi:hypothetical protein